MISIIGVGWVNRRSMGYKDNVRVFDSKKKLPRINRKDIFKESYKAFGRMDYFSKLGVAAIVFAMQDANRHDTPPKNTGMIASSSTGCLETDIKYQATLSREKNVLPSPAIFAYTLPSCFLGEASILYGLTGESFIINEDNTTGMTGLGMAVDLLALGQADMVLCGINNSDICNFHDKEILNTSGALFFVLENQKSESMDSYGELNLNTSNHNIYYKDSPINSLYDLAQRCLKRKL